MSLRSMQDSFTTCVHLYMNTYVQLRTNALSTYCAHYIAGSLCSLWDQALDLRTKGAKLTLSTKFNWQAMPLLREQDPL